MDIPALEKKTGVVWDFPSRPKSGRVIIRINFLISIKIRHGVFTRLVRRRIPEASGSLCDPTETLSRALKLLEGEMMGFPFCHFS